MNIAPTARAVPLLSGQKAWSRPTDDGAVRTADLEILSRLMDSAFVLPGTNLRFGLDSLIGLVPFLGDALTSLISLYLLGAASQRGISRATMVRMGANIAIDAAVGAVPLVGDLFDFYWRANQKNVELLKRHLAAAPDVVQRAQRSDRWFIAALVGGVALLLVGFATTAWWAMTGLVHLVAG